MFSYDCYSLSFREFSFPFFFFLMLDPLIFCILCSFFLGLLFLFWLFKRPCLYCVVFILSTLDWYLSHMENFRLARFSLRIWKAFCHLPAFGIAVKIFSVISDRKYKEVVKINDFFNRLKNFFWQRYHLKGPNGNSFYWKVK